VTAACSGDSEPAATETSTADTADTTTTATESVADGAIGGEGGTATSDDEMFAVEIPAGALTEPVSITIEVTTAADLGIEAGLLLSGPVYSLLPEGVTFTTPVTTVRRLNATDLGLEGDELPFFYVLQGIDGRWEPLSTRTNREGDLVVVRAQTSNFSPNISVESTQAWDQEIRAALTPGSFTAPTGASQETRFTLRGDADIGHISSRPEDEELTRTGAAAHYTRHSGGARATCGDAAGDGTYTAELNGYAGHDGADALFVSFFRGFQVEVVPQPFTVAVTGTATCTEPDTSLIDSVLGLGTGTLSFVPREGGPPGSPHTAPFEIEVDIDEGVFVIEKTQMPSNQQTTGPITRRPAPTSPSEATATSRPTSA
jgi:hypothetical protein